MKHKIIAIWRLLLASHYILIADDTLISRYPTDEKARNNITNLMKDLTEVFKKGKEKLMERSK